MTDEDIELTPYKDSIRKIDLDTIKINDNLNVFRISSFLTTFECNILMKLIDDVNNRYYHKNTLQDIVISSDIYQFMLPIIKERLLNIYNLKYKNKVAFELINKFTLSIHSVGNHIGFHIDDKVECNNNSNVLKFMIYLNKVDGGGTIFVPPKYKECDTDKHLNIIPNVGDMIIFDIDLMHSGAPILSGTKYLIGFRFKFNDI